jgi:2-methylcitrate synthase
MAEKAVGGAGLRGQSAGTTALCTVGKTGSGLTYRGFDIKELAEKAKFEEVAYLLLKGKLPNQAELDAYITKLKGLRGLPQALKTVLEQIPADAHPMDVMRTGCLHAGQPGDRAELRRAAGRLRPPAGRAALDHLLLVPLQP